MHDLDKTAFGAFVAGERKALGMTQKELAGKLCVSDKAVSKWERGLSLPDIALLEPLAEALNVGVAELLAGRRSENKPEEAETSVKKAVAFSEEPPERVRGRRKRNARIIGLCALATFSINLLSWLLGLELRWGFPYMGTMEILGIIYGIYFFLLHQGTSAGLLR